MGRIQDIFRRRTTTRAAKAESYHQNGRLPWEQSSQSRLEQAEDALINLMTMAAEDKEQMKAKDEIINDQVLLITSLTAVKRCQRQDLKSTIYAFGPRQPTRRQPHQHPKSQHLSANPDMGQR